jgi:N-acyl-D-amino-acid deacylase
MSNAIVLVGGDVLDGTGAPARRADVLVQNGRIAAIEPDLRGLDAEMVDVAGRVVAPGFVDLHSHADLTLLAFPTADSALRQGITTVATGNCGGGAAPLPPGERSLPVAFAYDPAWGIEIDWTSFGDYSARLDGLGVNVAPLVAHGSIRHATMGLGQRAATDDEIVAMRHLLDAALDEGAFGLSTGLEYQPGIWASREEIRSLVERVGRRGRTYATHMRDRAAAHGAATAEAIAAAVGTGARLQLSHFASRPNATPEARRAALAAVEAALAAGEPVGVDTFPETWGPALLIDLVPPWSLEGTPAEVLTRFGTASVRARIEAEIEREARFLARIAGYGEIYVSSTPVGTIAPGTSITELAAARSTSIVGAILDALLEHLRNRRRPRERPRALLLCHRKRRRRDDRRGVGVFAVLERIGVRVHGAHARALRAPHRVLHPCRGGPPLDVATGCAARPARPRRSGHRQLRRPGRVRSGRYPRSQ